MQSLLLNFTELLHASTTFDRSSEFYTCEAPILSIMLHFTTVRPHFDRLVRLETPTISMLRSARERMGHAAPWFVTQERHQIFEMAFHNPHITRYDHDIPELVGAREPQM